MKQLCIVLGVLAGVFFLTTIALSIARDRTQHQLLRCRQELKSTPLQAQQQQQEQETCPPCPQTLKTYRAEEAPGYVRNNNTADLEGQVYYTGSLIANRHANWRDRVMTEYEIEYLPTTNACPTEYVDQYFCPPYAEYAKCNPSGCARNTACEEDADCPGTGGVCTNGKCVCCSPGASCNDDRDCGEGKCKEGLCDCEGIDQDYACNVAMYPASTGAYGSTTAVGAVAAPVDSSVINAAGDSWVARGKWFSFPGEAECAPDQELGQDGCTWKQVGEPRAVTLRELGEQGFKFYCNDGGDFCFTKAEVAQNQRENLDVLGQVFGVDVSNAEGFQDWTENAESPYEPLESARNPRRMMTLQEAGLEPSDIHL
uniref:Uncharacterized protein n=1 Tax=viral metagenome TaxID=1070528 RepID=A0A6C0BPG1_9ZZZZ